MPVAYLGLGSNIGDRAKNIRDAIDLITRRPGIRITKVSSMYETAPEGYTEQPDFLNAVVEVETDACSEVLLKTALAVEREMGRVRNLPQGPRVIDIDVLLYDHECVNISELTIPHPRMLDRVFVMVPLAEIAPDLELPDGRTPCQVAESLGDRRIAKWPEAV